MKDNQTMKPNAIEILLMVMLITPLLILASMEIVSVYLNLINQDKG